MSPSRRIYLYWFLLLVPTLAVGFVALQLLRREQSRLLSRSGQVEEARRDALGARARLVVENLELLSGDVEASLLDTLASPNPGSLEDFLRRLPEGNPLVRATFLCTEDGRLVYPSADDVREEARGFRRRFARALGTEPPWLAPARERRDAPSSPAASSEAAAKAQRNELPDANLQSNTLQVQNLRRDLQQLARANIDRPAQRSSAAANRPADLDAFAGALSPLPSRTLSKLATADSAVPSSASADSATPSSSSVPKSATASSPSSQDLSAGRRGWHALVIDGRRHLLGWSQSVAYAPVTGLELDFSALAPRLAAILPVDLAAGESLVLRDDQGRILRQTGAAFSANTPLALRVPIGSALLAGWSVEARLLPSSYDGSFDDSAFFFVGALLVGILCIAILAGGSLLLRQARASALEALQKASFVSNVSHEFKTPLTTIRLYAELLEQQRVSDPHKRLEYLRTISRETQRLARLVGNALDFARLEQGRRLYRGEMLDLRAEAERIVEAQRPRLAECGLSPSVLLPEDSVFVRADRDALEQILLNLLDNACKYAASGGVLELSVLPPSLPRVTAVGGAHPLQKRTALPGNPSADRALLLVDDRGPGVPPDQRERIFEKFHRLDTRLTAEQGGVGLGLSIARRLARGLDGDLACLERPGGGARFALSLPCAADKPESAVRSADASPPPPDRAPGAPVVHPEPPRP